jgi:protein gp37
MAITTNIPWCNSTWNWVRGCDKVSEGCTNCYITSTTPFRTSGQKHGDPRVIASEATFNAPLQWNKKPWVCDDCGEPHETLWVEGCENTGNPLIWCRKCGNYVTMHRRRVFSLSLGDWLDRKIPVAVLVRALDIIRRCPDLDYLLCTKRPELFWERLGAVCDDAVTGTDFATWLRGWRFATNRPPRNVWILASAENQEMADTRIPELLKIPAEVRGLSCEPLLGPIDLRLSRVFATGKATEQFLGGREVTDNPARLRTEGHLLDWVIVGGESGKNARPCNVEWIRSIKDQCQTAGVPCFVKQLGAAPAVSRETDCTGYTMVHGDARVRLRDPKGGDPSEWPEELRVREFPAPGGAWRKERA